MAGHSPFLLGASRPAGDDQSDRPRPAHRTMRAASSFATVLFSWAPLTLGTADHGGQSAITRARMRRATVLVNGDGTGPPRAATPGSAVAPAGRWCTRLWSRLIPRCRRRRRRDRHRSSSPPNARSTRRARCVALRGAAGAHRRAAGAQPAAAGAGERGAHLVVLGRRRACCSSGRRVLAVRTRQEGAPALRVAPPRAQHYVQSLCQLSVYAYWGWYWPPGLRLRAAAPGPAALRLRVRHAAGVVASARTMSSASARFPSSSARTCFCGSRTTGSACSSLLIAVGFLGKAFVRWERDGRRVHIFNPSAFTLAVFSLVLLATDTTDLTWGQEIATTFSLGPRIYTVLFVIGLVVMYFFAITPVTVAAAATLFGGERALCRVDGCAVLRRFGHSVRGVSRSASARDRSVHVAAHAAGPGDLRRALRPRGVRPLRRPRRARAADVLRQAAVRAAAQSRRARDRSRRALRSASVRS